MQSEIMNRKTSKSEGVGRLKNSSCDCREYCSALQSTLLVTQQKEQGVQEKYAWHSKAETKMPWQMQVWSGSNVNSL